MENEFRDNFLQKHPEWNDLLEKIEREKRNLSSWEMIEGIANKTIDDEMLGLPDDTDDCEQDARDDMIVHDEF